MRFNSYNTFVDGQALYIGGGRGLNSTSPITETFKIDLSVNWTSDNPKFEQLADGPLGQIVPSTISLDNKQWLVFSDGHIYAMNFAAKTWLKVMDLPGIPRGGMAVIEPETGLIYVPHGIDNSMLEINLPAKNYTPYPMPTQLINSTYYSAAWSVSSRKLYLMGDDKQSKASLNLFPYTKSRPWLDLSPSTMGSIPSARSYACLVPAYGGSKLVLFGGLDLSNNTELGDIYVFDVDTLIWTNGSDTTAKDRRYGSACAISGDYFVSWGGVGSGGNTMTATTLIYNLKTNQWTTSYIAPLSTAAKDPASPPPSMTIYDEPSNSRASDAVVVGVSFFGVITAAILATIGFRYGSRRRRALKSANSSTHQP
ncbi:hypothetical protein BGX31_004352 [Mortierella sp. GBA43]|nr:hypothetical protein BGX31_004352 [Mortierella sp. GBA43]